MHKKRDQLLSAASKAAKKAKATEKTERKDTKIALKSKSTSKGSSTTEAHTVTEELVEGPPSRRANATLKACPNGGHLWCIGGEFFSDDGRAYFYNDRKFVSPTCPGPRSAHAVAVSLAGGGKIFLFGGEFSSLHQNTFHHYRNFWCFDITTHSWDRMDTKIRPSARSGHRMAFWKHYRVLFGGFYNPGVTTTPRYLNDLWLFDTQEYKWNQVEFREMDAKPSPRSGFSFLPCADGVILHGGYCEEYAKGKRPVGVMLDDTWLLKITLPSCTPKTTSKAPNKQPQTQPTIKWERRKRASDAYAPSLCSGCTMTLWAGKEMGILSGGVTDEDTNEETLESVFWNDLYGYQFTGKGKWSSMTLKKPKAKGVPSLKATETPKTATLDGPDPTDPLLTTPLPRYNAMLAVLRNTLYIYGGIYERGSREYTLDDFYALQLDKMDKYISLKESDVVIPDGDVESSSDDDEDDDSDDDGDDDDDYREIDGENFDNAAESAEEEDQSTTKIDLIDEEPKLSQVKDELRSQATAFMGVSKDTTRSPEDIQSTPLPGETLAMFYARSREYWTQKAHGNSDNKGKQLRRDGFTLAEERYTEVEKILEEAGLDEEEMRRGAAGGGLPLSAGGVVGFSRNRR
ncbi:galactose oxidase [Phlegmacium glaucopus]|nr:galactose oxidase [Phlegmacium glaucopus]